MKTPFILTTAFLLMLAVGCEKEPQNNNIVIPPTDTFPKNWEFTVIEKGERGSPYNGNSSRAVYVISNDSEWNAIRNNIYLIDTSVITNFDSCTILAVFNDLSVSGPNLINVVNVMEERDTIFIEVESSFGPTHTPSQGYEIIKTSKVMKSVLIRE